MSLLLVPHKDLAFQYYHWIERLYHHLAPSGSHLRSLAQVFISRATEQVDATLSGLKTTPPRILICTPQALHDVIRADAMALPLDRLSAVAVDEADYLIESVPVLKDKYRMKKIERQIKRHPGPTRQVLNHIYGTADAKESDRKRAQRHSARNDLRRDTAAVGMKGPQLIMMSATLRNHLKRSLLADSGWFTNESKNLVRITSGHGSSLMGLQGNGEDYAEFTVGGAGITHHVLVVSETGDITNHEDAIDSPLIETKTADASLKGAHSIVAASSENDKEVTSFEKAEGDLELLPLSDFMGDPGRSSSSH